MRGLIVEVAYFAQDDGIMRYPHCGCGIHTVGVLFFLHQSIQL